MKRLNPTAARFVLLAASVVLSLWLGRSAVKRLWARSPTPSPYGLRLEDDLGRPLGKAHGPLRLVLDPFTVYRTAPNQNSANYTIDQHGWRGGVRYPDRPSVVVLGGSAVFGQELANDDETFCRRLEERTGSHSVVNAGVVGYLSGQELALYVHAFRDSKAAAVVLMDGWNELFDQWQFERRQGGAFGFNNQFFEIRDRLATFHLGKPAPLNKPKVADDDAYFDSLSRAYFSNVLEMNRLAKARGSRFLWAVQPELGGKEILSSKEGDCLKLWDRTYGYQRRGFPAKYADLKRRATEYARDHGIEFVDVGGEPEWKTGEMLFADPVHPNAVGHERIAAILYRRLGLMLQMHSLASARK